MSLSVSSWFVDQARRENPSLVRSFTVGGSDYTDHVLRWPSVMRKWNDIRPTNITIGLANEDQTFNFFRLDKTKLRSACEFRLGFRRWGGAQNVTGGDRLTVTPTSGGALDLSTNSDYSFEAYFAPSSATLAGSGYLWSRGGTTGLLFDANRKFRFWAADSAGAVVEALDATSRSFGTEYHVVGVRSKTSRYAALYVDGALVASAAITSLSQLYAATTAFVALGVTSANAAYGLLDEARYYGAALSADEASLHRQGFFNTSAESSLLVHLGLDEPSSGTVVNSGLGLGAVAIVNSPSFVEKAFDRRRGLGRAETIQVFYGTSEVVTLDDGQATLTMVDKIKAFSERIVGVSNVPAVFSASNLLPSDIAWTLCTCYGGLSGVQSTSNPDIDYASWQSWAAVFSADTVLVRARFEGQKVTECLRKLGKHTQSAIFVSDNKLSFHRFTSVNTNVSSLSPDHLLGLSISIDDADMVNKQWVNADYRPESNYWSISVFDARTASINSFGLREQIEQDESVWYVNSANALNYAQRVMSTAGVPYDRISAETPLVPVYLTIGDTVVVYEPHTGTTEGWRIMGYRLDMESGRLTLDIDGSQVNTPFILDVSTLDGPDILL